MCPAGGEPSLEQTRYTDTRLGIVCPVANEEATIEVFVKEVLAVCDSFAFADIQMFLVVDRVSRDNTLDIVRELAAAMGPVRCVWVPDNRSIVDAYMRGYHEAIQAGCDWILEIDAGFSHQPQDIVRFVEHMAAGKDCVFGSRFARGGYFERTAWKRWVVSKGGTLLTNMVLGTTLTDMTSGFECFTRQALQKILAMGIHSKGPFFQTEIRFHARRLDYAEVPICYRIPVCSRRTKVVRESLRQLWRLYKIKRKESPS